MPPPILLFAAEASGLDPVTVLLQYGPLGVFCVLLVTYFWTSDRREKERTSRAEQRVEELEKYIRDEFLPKQLESNYLHKQTADVLAQCLQRLTELKAERDYEQRRAERAEQRARKLDGG